MTLHMHKLNCTSVLSVLLPCNIHKLIIHELNVKVSLVSKLVLLMAKHRMCESKHLQIDFYDSI